ncbi:MAG TPA: hypothetical protein VFQ35_21715 [Polyangiaceae bacterium]|nr:hypothetical protein [Polyangiaceae bacterium]
MGFALLAVALGAAATLPGCALDVDECLPGEAVCDGDVARVCVTGEYGGRRGHLWSSRDCGDAACVAVDGPSGVREAFCALSSDVDARCTEPEGASCDGEQLIACHVGRATSVTRCARGCVSLDDLPDYCREDPPEHARCVTGQGCELAGPAFTATAASAPGANCSAAPFGPAADPTMHVYAYRCEDGLLTARQRCASVCLSEADCSTHCS